MALNKQHVTLVSALGLGAGLMYFLDPQGGGSRRALVRDKAVKAAHSGSDVLRKTSRDLGNRSKGLAAGLRSKVGSGFGLLRLRGRGDGSQERHEDGGAKQLESWSGNESEPLATLGDAEGAAELRQEFGAH